MVLNLLGERGSGKHSIGVAVRFLNHRDFDLGVNEVTAALGTLEHPLGHWRRDFPVTASKPKHHLNQHEQCHCLS